MQRGCRSCRTQIDVCCETRQARVASVRNVRLANVVTKGNGHMLMLEKSLDVGG